MAKIGLRIVESTGREHAGLTAALRAAGKLGSGVQKPTKEELIQWVADVRSQGDPERGERIFRRAALACTKCHSISGAGGQVGPDLVSIGASAQVDYLVESLLDPNKAVKENYNALLVTTVDGRALTGIKIRETEQVLVLRNAEDREVTIPKGDVDEALPGKSLMPAGLVESLTRAELVDLVRFLSELGKVGPYAATRVPLARRWQVLQSTQDGNFALRRTGLHTAASDDARLSWAPAYSQAGGTLPLAELPRIQFHRDMQPVAIVRTELDVTTAGKLALKLDNTTGLSLWIDGEPVDVSERIELDLPSGRHTLTIAAVLQQHPPQLRLELEEDTAAAQWTYGK